MNEVTWTKEDIDLVEKFITIKNKGLYVNGNELTEVYNRILHKDRRPTQCGSCLRAMTQELENALNAFKRIVEAQKQAEPTTIPPEENNVSEAPKQRRVGRPPKKDK